MICLASLLTWHEGGFARPGAEHPCSIVVLATHSHVLPVSPRLRPFPARDDTTRRALGVKETIDSEEEDGHLAILANIFLELQPVALPILPSFLISVAPEGDTSLFLSLGRFRC